MICECKGKFHKENQTGQGGGGGGATENVRKRR